MAKTQVKLKGTKELNRAIKKAKRKLDHKELQAIFQQGAQMMEDEAKRRTPSGPTGNLKDAIYTRQMGTDPLVYIAAVDRTQAPHAHLVEHGTGPRYQDETGKYVGEMPANPYWRPAWDTISPRIESFLLKELRRRVGGS